MEPTTITLLSISTIGSIITSFLAIFNHCKNSECSSGCCKFTIENNEVK